MRRIVPAVLLTVLLACSGGGPSTTGDTVPDDILPPEGATARVSVTVAGGQSVGVPADVVAGVVPLLVRRVFDAREPLSSYGLDAPTATITFLLGDGSRVVLSVGRQEFDGSAAYVRRSDDDRIWIVLDESLDPLLAVAK